MPIKPMGRHLFPYAGATYVSMEINILYRPSYRRSAPHMGSRCQGGPVRRQKKPTPHLYQIPVLLQLLSLQQLSHT